MAAACPPGLGSPPREPPALHPERTAQPGKRHFPDGRREVGGLERGSTELDSVQVRWAETRPASALPPWGRLGRDEAWKVPRPGPPGATLCSESLSP